MSTYRIHWGWAITAVYSCFALLTLGFVGFALTQELDLVRTDYYEYSLLHDQRMRARSAASALSDAHLRVGSTAVIVQLPAHHVGAEGSVFFYHPGTIHDDRSMPLVTDNSGLMMIPVDACRTGKWIVTVTWQYQNVAYEMQKEFIR